MVQYAAMCVDEGRQGILGQVCLGCHGLGVFVSAPVLGLSWVQASVLAGAGVGR